MKFTYSILLFTFLVVVKVNSQTLSMPLVVGDDAPAEHNVRFATFYDNNLSSTPKYINFGKNNTSYNSGEISFTLTGNNSANNLVTFALYGQAENQRVYLRGDGNLGIGTKTPYYKLDVNGKSHIYEFPLIVGNDYPADQPYRFAMFYDNTMNGNSKFINFGKNNSGYNCGELSFHHIADNSVENYVGIGLYNKGILYLKANGRIGVGHNNPSSNLDVMGTIQSRPITEGGGANIIIGDDFLNDGNIRRWVIDRRNDNYFGQGNKGLVLWADKSNGYYAPILLKDDGNLILVGAQNAVNNNVLIGKNSQTNSIYKLDVAGKIRADEIVVNTSGADFVFDSSYKLRTLSELETFIKANKHLPDMAPAKEMQENGVSAGEMQTKLLQKVEELTLYVIEQNKTIEKQVADINDLKNIVGQQQKEIANLKNQKR